MARLAREVVAGRKRAPSGGGRAAAGPPTLRLQGLGAALDHPLQRSRPSLASPNLRLGKPQTPHGQTPFPLSGSVAAGIPWPSSSSAAAPAALCGRNGGASAPAEEQQCAQVRPDAPEVSPLPTGVPGLAPASQTSTQTGRLQGSTPPLPPPPPLAPSLCPLPIACRCPPSLCSILRPLSLPPNRPTNWPQAAAVAGRL